MKSLHKHILEKLIINKDYNFSENIDFTKSKYLLYITFDYNHRNNKANLNIALMHNNKSKKLSEKRIKVSCNYIKNGWSISYVYNLSNNAIMLYNIDYSITTKQFEIIIDPHKNLQTNDFLKTIKHNKEYTIENILTKLDLSCEKNEIEEFLKDDNDFDILLKSSFILFNDDTELNDIYNIINEKP